MSEFQQNERVLIIGREENQMGTYIGPGQENMIIVQLDSGAEQAVHKNSIIRVGTRVFVRRLGLAEVVGFIEESGQYGARVRVNRVTEVNVFLNDLFTYRHRIDTCVFLDFGRIDRTDRTDRTDRRDIELNRVGILEGYDVRGLGKGDLIALVRIGGTTYSKFAREIIDCPGEIGSAVQIRGGTRGRVAGYQMIRDRNRTQLHVDVILQDSSVIQVPRHDVKAFLHMPSQEDFPKHLHHCRESKNHAQWLLSLQQILPPTLLQFELPTPDGRRMFDIAERQWVTDKRSGIGGTPLDYSRTQLDSFFDTHFSKDDKVLCVDYENEEKKTSSSITGVQRTDNAQTMNKIVEMAIEKKCNKILLISKSKDSQEFIKQDFKSVFTGTKIECKTLFLESSSMFFKFQDPEVRERGRDDWTAWCQSDPTVDEVIREKCKLDSKTSCEYKPTAEEMSAAIAERRAKVAESRTFWGGRTYPPLLEDAWQNLLGRVDDSQLKKLRGEDDAMLTIALHSLMRKKISFCLMSDDSRMLLDYVRNAHFLPSFKCESGFFSKEDDDRHQTFNKFGVRLFQHPHCMTQEDINRLINLLTFGCESSGVGSAVASGASASASLSGESSARAAPEFDATVGSASLRESDRGYEEPVRGGLNRGRGGPNRGRGGPNRGRGDSSSGSRYHHKYLKYKQKYLLLKQKLGL